MSKSNMRRSQYVDSKVQGALVWRVFLYWVACQAIFLSALVCWEMFTGSARPIYEQFDLIWYRYAPALILSAIVLPIILLDLIRLSNRFVGPMVRFRRAMRDLSRGHAVFPLSFRDNDFWRDCATDFNRLAERIQALQQTRDIINSQIGQEELDKEKREREEELIHVGPLDEVIGDWDNPKHE
jgi:hypothetical protein